MKKYLSVYELEAELKSQGYKTTDELDLEIMADSDPNEGCLTGDDGQLHDYPLYKAYYIIKAN